MNTFQSVQFLTPVLLRGSYTSLYVAANYPGFTCTGDGFWIVFQRPGQDPLGVPITNIRFATRFKEEEAAPSEE